MPNEASIVDPRIYGGQPLVDTNVPTFDPALFEAGPTSNPDYVAPKADQSKIGAGGMSEAVGQLNLAIANRPRAGLGDAATAAVKTWSTTRMFDAINAPAFTDEAGFDPKPLINGAQFALTDEEHRFLAQSKSQGEYDFRYSAITDQRDLYQKQGDHPLLSALIGFADPIYFGIDVLSLGAGRIASVAGAGVRMSRVSAAAAAVAGTGGVGIVEQGVSPVSDAEVVGMALLNGAATAMVYRNGRMRPADPTYPTDELATAARKLEGVDVAVERRLASEAVEAAESGVVPELKAQRRLTEADAKGFGVDLKAPKEDAYTVLTRHVDNPEFGPVIRSLQEEYADMLTQIGVGRTTRKRSFYFDGEHSVYLAKGGDDARTVLHEVIHGLTVHKLNFGKANPGSAHGKVTAELEAIRKQALRASRELQANQVTKYLAGDLKEFVAGLFYGDSQFIRMMKSLPADGAPNMLSKMVNAVRKVLGIPPSQASALTKALELTEDLIREKGTVKLAPRDGITATLHMAPPSGTPSQQAATILKRQDSASAKVGDSISWSLHKTLGNLGTEGKRVADTLVDDPLNMTGDSVVSQRTAIRSDLTAKQVVYEDKLRTALKEQGTGTWQRVSDPAAAAMAQNRMEREVMQELIQRESHYRSGQTRTTDIDPTIKGIADAHDQATAAALRERKAAGELGAEAVDELPGYFQRKWSVTGIENVERKFADAFGLTEKAARREVRGMVQEAIARANPGIDKEVSKDIAAAVIERARRKGYFEDSAFRSHAGNEAAKEIRDILESANLSASRVQKAMDVITGVTDEAGKASTMKHRVAMDMTVTRELPDGSTVSLLDMLDTNLTRNLDQYLDASAGNAALARKGLRTATDVDNLRTDYLRGIPSESDRARAAQLFDDTLNSIRGNPTGEQMNDAMRKLQALTQMVGLSSSGLWQVTEYANVAAKYGLAKTTKEFLRTMPVFKQLLGEVADGRNAAEGLATVLSRNSAQDIRMRPIVAKFEDNFNFDMGDTMQLRLQEAKQWVPYINAMRYIHHNQANVVGNLVADTVARAARGDKRASEVLTKYGLESHLLDKVKAEVATAGLDTAKWSDDTWAAVRGPMNKMMDEAVLRNRTGEIPAFAQFSTLGKFIFTFRSFVLGAHNKVLAGTLGREGFGGLGLLMLYQFPLTVAATAANQAMRGKPETDPATLAMQAVAQMGSVGLFSELFGIISGEKQQFGASGLIAIDRVYKAGSSLAQGNYGSAAQGAINALPIISILPGIKALSETLKD